MGALLEITWSYKTCPVHRDAVVAYLTASASVPLATYVLYPQAAAASAHDSHATVLQAEPSVAYVRPLFAFDPFRSIAPANSHYPESVLIGHHIPVMQKKPSGLCTQPFCEFMTSTDRFADCSPCLEPTLSRSSSLICDCMRGQQLPFVA